MSQSESVDGVEVQHHDGAVALTWAALTSRRIIRRRAWR
jgi:hypothetical protein